MAPSHQDGLDPTGAQTPEAFMELLRQARTASGLSIVEIVERARKRGYELDPVSLNRSLELPTLPSWQTVTGVLTACGMGGMQIDRWMRVYHDLAAPAQPVAAGAPVAAVQEPVDDVEPVSVPPLVLTTAPATSPRLGRRHFALAAGVLVALIMVPLLLFALFNDEPGTVAAEATSAAPGFSAAAPPAPAPSDLPVGEPSASEAAAPTTPGSPPRTTRPPTRTTAPPPPASPPPAEPVVLRSGVVELTGNHGFDLDSGQTQGTRDIYRANDDTLVSLNGSGLEPMSGIPSKQTCQAERGWEEWVGNLQPGQWLCVRTSDGRFGRLNITAVGNMLKLAYTVWT